MHSTSWATGAPLWHPFLKCDAVVFGRISTENLTCSISIPSSMRSRLSWNELTQLQHRGKYVGTSRHADTWHKISHGHGCAFYNLKFSNLASPSDNRGTHGRRQFLNLSGSSIWDSNPVVNSCTIWGYLGLFCSCFCILFWKTTWSTARGGKDKDQKNQKWRNWFHLLAWCVLKLGLRAFTNLIGCAALFQGDTCLSEKDAKYTFICLFWSRVLRLATTATLLCLYGEKRIQLIII